MRNYLFLATPQVNSTKPDGVYGIGEEIYIDVYLSTPVVSVSVRERASERPLLETKGFIRYHFHEEMFD